MASIPSAISSSTTAADSLTAAERALKASLEPAEFRDVHLYAFSRRTVYLSTGTVKIDHPLPVSAVGSILQDTEYFSTLLASGFSESDPSAAAPIRQRAHPSEYDYETDSDLDEFEDRYSDLVTPSTPGPPSAASGSNWKGKARSNGDEHSDDPTGLGTTQRRILLPSVAHKTLKACIFYLYTGKVNFLPLTSEGVEDRRFRLITTSANAAPACSPKSIYRLAELYGMTELQELAFQDIISRLSPRNIVEEAFSSFFARYDRLREHAVSYLSQHYTERAIQESLPDTIERMAMGELPHAGGVLRSLLGLRIAMAAQPQAVQVAAPLSTRSAEDTESPAPITAVPPPATSGSSSTEGSTQPATEISADGGGSVSVRHTVWGSSTSAKSLQSQVLGGSRPSDASGSSPRSEWGSINAATGSGRFTRTSWDTVPDAMPPTPRIAPQTGPASFASFEAEMPTSPDILPETKKKKGKKRTLKCQAHREESRVLSPAI